MAVTVGTNSWVTIEQADMYFGSRMGSGDWFALEDSASNGADSKESALVTAFYWLLFDSAYNLSSDLDSPYVRQAQIEAALFLLGHREEYEERAALIAGGVSKVKSSRWEEELGRAEKPARVKAALIRGGFASFGGAIVQLGDD